MTLSESSTFLFDAIKQGKSLIEVVTTYTAITASQLAIVADTILQSLRATHYHLQKVKSMTGSTKAAIERSLSKSLVCFLYELHRMNGTAHYNDVRNLVKEKYDLQTNDYGSLLGRDNNG